MSQVTYWSRRIVEKNQAIGFCDSRNGASIPLTLFYVFIMQFTLLARVEKLKASFEPLRHNFEAEEG